MSETGEAASGRLLASGQQVREIAHAARNLLQILVSAVDMMRRQPPSSQADGQPGCILADAERRGRDEGGRLLQAIEDVMDQPQLRVAVVEDDPVIRAALARQLAEDCGHAVVGQAETGDGLVELMAEMKPDIAVFDIHLPPGRDGLDAFREGCRRAGRLVAGVAVTGDPDVGLMERASEEGLVLAYLLKPVRPEQLRSAVLLAHARLRQMRLLRDEADTHAQALADRRVVEQAKWLVGRETKANEAESYRALHRAASERRERLADFCQAVLDGGPTGAGLRAAAAHLPDGCVHAAARRLIQRTLGLPDGEGERELRACAAAMRLSHANFGRRILASESPAELMGPALSHHEAGAGT